ncbi:MAG: hypothetical protein KDK39_00495 [Leptospiraceae bacterium]|nr:hypothetical protein [Leptospiraceae bacterium]
MKIPVRSNDGVLRLRRGDFGIKDPVYLHALRDFVCGYSNEQSAQRITDNLGVRISRIMIRDNFRTVLYSELREFQGTNACLSFARFCQQNNMPAEFEGKNSIQMAFCVARYLLEEFDLYEPIEIINSSE